MLFLIILFGSRPDISAEVEGYEFPDPENFSKSAGIEIPTDGDSPTFVGTMDINGDEKPDLVTGEEGTFSTYVNVLGTKEAKKGIFVKQGESFEAEGKFLGILGGDFDGDGDYDLAVAVEEYGDVIMKEITGQITGITPETITDNKAKWRRDGLRNLEINPNIQQEQKFKVEGNTDASELDHPLTYLGIDPLTGLLAQLPLPPLTLKIKDDFDLTKIAQVGDWYSYELGDILTPEKSEIKVFLNDGNGAFTEAKCSGGLELPKNRLIDDFVQGDFIPDGNIDLAVQHAEYLEGIARKVEIRIESVSQGNFSSLDDFLKKYDFLKGHRYDREEGDLIALISIIDDTANFDNLRNLLINPNLKQKNLYIIRSSAADEVEFEVILDLDWGLGTIENLLRNLAIPGDTYRIKIENTEIDVFQGFGNGCFKPVRLMSGEIYALYYGNIDTTINGESFSGVYSALVDNTANFLPENGLVGRRINPAVTRDEDGKPKWAETGDTYTIIANTETTIYVAENLTLFCQDMIHDRDPDIYMILPENAELNFDLEIAQESALRTFKLPPGFTTLGFYLGDKGPPYAAAFADFDNDGDDDLVYSALNLFYKENLEK